MARGKLTIEVLRNRHGDWYYHEKASGRILDHSEAYASKSNALRAARRKAARTPGAVVQVVAA